MAAIEWTSSGAGELFADGFLEQLREDWPD
jgi:hypothetical protein